MQLNFQKTLSLRTTYPKHCPPPNKIIMQSLLRTHRRYVTKPTFFNLYIYMYSLLWFRGSHKTTRSKNVLSTTCNPLDWWMLADLKYIWERSQQMMVIMKVAPITNIVPCLTLVLNYFLCHTMEDSCHKVKSDQNFCVIFYLREMWIM